MREFAPLPNAEGGVQQPCPLDEALRRMAACRGSDHGVGLKDIVANAGSTPKPSVALQRSGPFYFEVRVSRRRGQSA